MPAERITEEGDVIFGYAREPGLGLVHLQPEPRHQRCHPCLRPHGIAGPAADHEIIRIIDDMSIELILVPWRPDGVAYLFRSPGEDYQVASGDDWS